MCPVVLLPVVLQPDLHPPLFLNPLNLYLPFVHSDSLRVLVPLVVSTGQTHTTPTTDGRVGTGDKTVDSPVSTFPRTPTVLPSPRPQVGRDVQRTCRECGCDALVVDGVACREGPRRGSRRPRGPVALGEATTRPPPPVCVAPGSVGRPTQDANEVHSSDLDKHSSYCFH